MTTQVTKTQWLLALVVAAILPAGALAQTPRERIDQAMTRAQQAGIPVSLLESKIAEGRAKGVGMERIAIAVESRLRNAEQAKVIMTRGAGDVDAAQLSVGADAIGAGVTEAVLEKIAASASRDRRAVAVAALTQLVLHGITPDAALVRVQEALASGPQALANLAAQPGGDNRIPEPTGSSGGNRGATGIPSKGGTPGSVSPPRIVVPPRGPTSGRGPGRGY
jgi:hypothetical protein